MTFVQVDIQRVRAERMGAEHRAEAATADRIKAEADERAALDEVVLLKRVEDTILRAVVSEPKKVPEREDSIEEDLPAVPAPYGPLTNQTTRQAVLWALRKEVGRVWPLDELVAFMKSQGFQGTHNAVHVQLSRLIGTEDGFDLQRVKTGHYRAVSSEELLLKSEPNPDLDEMVDDLRRMGHDLGRRGAE